MYGWSKQFLSVVFVLLWAALLSACEDGSDRHPGTEIPELPGVVEGRLLPLISGITYSTATLGGTTDEAGMFRYRSGETVEFKLGQTLLGSVPGQARITLADLAGTEFLVGTAELRRVVQLERHPFHFLINRAVLLYSLDADGNAENGVQITREIVDLIGDSVFPLEQHWGDFRSAYPLRKVLKQGYEQGFYTQSRPPAGLAASMSAAYQSAEVSPAIRGVTRQQSPGPDGTQTWLEMTYDKNGYPLKRMNSGITEFERQYNQQQEQVWEKEWWCREVVWTYSPYGYLLHFETIALSDASSESEITYKVGSYGNTLSLEEDYNKDGTVDHYETWEYDDQGRPIRHEKTFYDQSSRDSLEETTYDDSGNPVYIKFLNIESGDYAETSMQYDAKNRRIVKEYIQSDDLGKSRETWQYFDNEVISQWEQTTDFGRSANIYYLTGRFKTRLIVSERRTEERQFNQFGAFENTISSDYDADGLVDHITIEQRAPNNWLITRSVDSNADGIIDEVLINNTVEYNSLGQIVYFKDVSNIIDVGETVTEYRYEYDGAGDLVTQYRNGEILFTYEYEDIGWGGVFEAQYALDWDSIEGGDQIPQWCW